MEIRQTWNILVVTGGEPGIRTVPVAVPVPPGGLPLPAPDLPLAGDRFYPPVPRRTGMPASAADRVVLTPRHGLVSPPLVYGREGRPLYGGEAAPVPAKGFFIDVRA